MTLYWLVVALFIGGALLMLLSPLGLPGGKGATSRPSRRTAWALLLVVPLASVGLYLAFGSPHLAAPAAAPRAAAPATERHALEPAQIEQRVAALAERLRARPDDVDGWLMLARSYTTLGRYRDAAVALRRAHDLRPEHPGILADLADLIGMAQGKRLAGEPARLIQQALDRDPRHPKALALAGSVSFEARDWTAARGYWTRLLEVLPAESPMARSIRGSLAEVDRIEGGTPVGERKAR